MKLSDIHALLPGSEQFGSHDPEIGGVTHDSRRVQPGYLFVCVTGQKSDGHDYLAAAAEKGAVAALVERSMMRTSPFIPSAM